MNEHEILDEYRRLQEIVNEDPHRRLAAQERQGELEQRWMQLGLREQDLRGQSRKSQ